MGIAGYESDIEIAQYLFDLIRYQIQTQSNMFSSGKKAANDFKMSAVLGVHSKLLAIKAASSVQDQTGTALVLSRSKEVETWVRTQMNLRTVKAVGFSLNQLGYKTGQDVRLSPGIGSSGVPAGIGMEPKRIV